MGRHLKHAGGVWRLCNKVPIPEWPQPGTDDEVRFRPRLDWPYDDHSWSGQPHDVWRDRRVAMCTRPVEVPNE